MLISVQGCVVNAYIEPQFKGMSSDQIVTVEFAEWESLVWFRKKLGGDIRFTQYAKYFPFTGYIQLEALNEFLVGKTLSISELESGQDLSPAPVAFSFDALTYWEEDEYGDIICDGANEWGFCFPEDVLSVWNDSDAKYEQFHTFPHFTLPEELKDRHSLWSTDIEEMTEEEVVEAWEQSKVVVEKSADRD